MKIGGNTVKGGPPEVPKMTLKSIGERYRFLSHSWCSLKIPVYIQEFSDCTRDPSYLTHGFKFQSRCCSV